jgi:hypothetical protein
MLPVMGMLLLLGVTLFTERYFCKDSNFIYNVIGKILGILIAVLYYFYLLPIPVRRSSEATLFLFCMMGFLFASLVRDAYLLFRYKKSNIAVS